jgi:hypothetical protein
VQYHARLDASQGLQFPRTIYAVPRFETGDERYTRLNRIQAIGKGHSTRICRPGTAAAVPDGLRDLGDDHGPGTLMCQQRGR